MTLPYADTPTLAFVGAMGLALAWNVVYAGRISRLRRAPRPLAALSAACGLLVAPAVVVRLASASVLGGRAIAVVAWLWPLVTLLFVAQAAYATLRRLVTPFVGVPLLAYDLLLLGLAWTAWLLRVRGDAPLPLLALSAAQASVLGTLLGRAALWTPFVALVPLMVPAYPARWRMTRATRAILSLGAAGLTAIIVLALPSGFGTVRSYQAYAADRLSERPDADFALGVKLLPTLGSFPSAAAVRDALPLADTLDIDAVALTLRPGALTLAALDSTAKLVEPMRRDSALLIVTLGFDADDRRALRTDRATFLARRLAAVERLARALRPDILLPAEAPYGADRDVLGVQPVAFWEDYLGAAAARAHSVNRRIRVAVAAARFDAADSTLYAWAASRESPLDAVGFVVAPSFTGGAGVDARLRAADRWLAAAAGAPDRPPRAKPHWLFDVRGFPMAHGDVSQERTVWHTLSWATGHREFAGAVIAEPDDYLSTSGLRAANGRFRPAVAAMSRAARGLREAAAQ